MSYIVTCHFYAANITEYLPKFNIQNIQNLFAGGNRYPIANEAKPFIDLTTDDGSNSSIVEEVTFQYDLEKTNGVIPRLTLGYDNQLDGWFHLDGNDRDYYYNAKNNVSFVKIDDISSGNPMENDFTYDMTCFSWDKDKGFKYRTNILSYLFWGRNTSAYLIPLNHSYEIYYKLHTGSDTNITENITITDAYFKGPNDDDITTEPQTVEVGELVCPLLNTFLCTYNGEKYYLRSENQTIGVVKNMLTSNFDTLEIKNHSVLRYTSQRHSKEGSSLNTTANNFNIYI